MLLTDDVANRQKAEKEGLHCLSGECIYANMRYRMHFIDYALVRKYIEGLKDSSQLLDLLSTPGSESLEPTAAAGARQALYPDVSGHGSGYCHRNERTPQRSTCLWLRCLLV